MAVDTSNMTITNDPYNIGNYGGALSAGAGQGIGNTISSEGIDDLINSIAGGGSLFGNLLGGLGQIGSALSPALPGIAGTLLTGEAYNRLSGVGREAEQAAMNLAERELAESQFKPFTVTTTTGGQLGTRVTPTGAVETTMGLSPQEQMLQQQLMGQAGQIFGQPVTGQAQLAQAGLGALGAGQQLMGQPTFGVMPTQEAAQQAFGLGGQFMGAAGMPTTDREQALFERMRTVQRPEEERQRLALEERLAAQGRLGTSSAAYGGATPEQLAMATAQEEARSRAMLNAMQQARAEQAQQAALGAQYAGLGTTLSGQQQALDAARQQQALQALTAGQGLLGGGLGLQQLQQQLGTTALGASYLPQTQLLAATQPAQRMAELQQQAQLYGTGLFGETALSGIEARLLAEQARANLLGGVGSSILSGLFTPQVTSSGTILDPGGFGNLGDIFGGIGEGLGTIGRATGIFGDD